MFQFLPSREPSTIAVQVRGKVTKEDAENLEQYVKKEFGDDTPFNILAIFLDVGGTTFQGITEGSKFDAKRWGQFRKFAVVSDKNLMKVSAKLGDYLPGITVEYFEVDQVEEAWNWIKE
ncbi:STAS/SEC14 domain-containing protein [Oceanobacillus massiliensis]|uniref:STAS/SEC14 domain-containing protein n=1 Tax=Oceanobacillus massiliensis TaxID=1465765 RepID=UPI000287CB6D|nr:STAS/SEC14 domain-containing protein [Oceanobacillus massiliensis]